MITTELPQIILDISAKLNGASPSVGLCSMANVFFVYRGHGTIAAVVFVVALAIEVLNEMLLQGTGNALGHVIIHLCNAEWHADGLIVTIHGTRICLHRRMIEVDAGCDTTTLRRIGT